MGEYFYHVPELPRSQDQNDSGRSYSAYSTGIISACKVVQFIGKLTAAAQVVLPAPLFYQHLQRGLQEDLARANQSYESSLQLSQVSHEEILWWQEHLTW